MPLATARRISLRPFSLSVGAACKRAASGNQVRAVQASLCRTNRHLPPL